MTAERFVVAGLARVRAPWFSEVAAWANTSQLPIDFLKCVSAAEVAARIEGARPLSALLVGATVSGVDRDLIDRARSRSVAVIVVTDGSDGFDWVGLGAVAVLPPTFDRPTLLACLSEHSQPIRSAHGAGVREPGGRDGGADGGAGRTHPDGRWQGNLVAVTGGSGCGVSTVAMAIAQGLAAAPGHEESVALADFATCGDLAMYHDAGDVVPGLQELVEAHRTTNPPRHLIRDGLFDIEARGYSLLLGLRRSRDWTVLRPRALDAAVDSLLATFRSVVVDVSAEFDGEDATGSVDIEERNGPSRVATTRADVVVVCVDASLKGIHSLLRIERDLHDLGVAEERLVRLVNRAPRSPRRRAELAAAIDDLSPRGPSAVRLATVFVPLRRDVESCHALAQPLPSAIVAPVTAAVVAMGGRRVAA